MKIATIIPAYNEEKTIAKVVREMKQFSDEVIVIDDGSKDTTRSIAASAGAVVVPNPVNLGMGVSVRRGYKIAVQRNADIIIQTDADDQYTAADVPKLIKPIIENKADMVIASRFLGGIESMPQRKKLGNQFCTMITNLVAGTRLSDTQSGFRAMRKELLMQISPTGKKDYVHEMVIRASREGWRIAEVPSYFKQRKFGDSRLFSSLTVYAYRFASAILKMIYKYYLLPNKRRAGMK
jgi:glycosyltransferase involved in cell wall biosynthesis